MWGVMKTIGRFAWHYPTWALTMLLAVAIVLTATIVALKAQPQTEPPTQQCVSADWQGNCTTWAYLSCRTHYRSGCPGWMTYHNGRPVLQLCWADGTDTEGRPFRRCQESF